MEILRLYVPVPSTRIAFISESELPGEPPLSCEHPTEKIKTNAAKKVMPVFLIIVLP